MGEGKRRMKAMGAPEGCVAPMVYAKAKAYWLGSHAPDVEMSAQMLLVKMITGASMPSAYNTQANPLEAWKPDLDLRFHDEDGPKWFLVDAGGRIAAGGDRASGPEITHAVESRGLAKATIDLLPGYVEVEEEETIWIQKGTHILVHADGRPVTDPVALCEGRLRRAPGSSDYFKADAPLTCQLGVAEADSEAERIPEENFRHVLGFMQSCQRHPSAKTRAIGAYADQQAAMALMTGVIKPTEFGLILDMREVVMDIFERRPALAVYEEILSSTTLPDGQATTRAFDERTRDGDWRSNQIFADALMGVLGRTPKAIPETAAMISLEHGSPTAARDMSLVSVQSFLASMTPVSTVDDAQVIAALYALEEGFAMALMGSDLTNLVFWDDAKAAAEIKSRAAAVPEKRSGH